MSPFENNVLMVSLDLPSSSTASKCVSTTPKCAVCGEEKVNSARYGAPACLGCVVFFRRAIVNDLKYKCLRNQRCEITNEYRCSCRYCRLQKCFAVGMKAESIQRRDIVGPRRPMNFGKDGSIHFNSNSSNRNSPEVIAMDTTDLLRVLVDFQKQQVTQHSQYFTSSDQPSPNMYRRARAHDVNIMLKLSLNQASEWGKQFKPFKRLSAESKKSILAEYGLAFLLIDQGFKTAREAEEGFWLLQNGSFMHPDYFLGLPDADSRRENAKVKAELHQKFMSELLNCVGGPFRNLEIDEVECAALKTVLLLTPSFSQRAIYSGQEGNVASIHTKCMEELMEHCQTKSPSPNHGAQRFGEILLLISSLRCGVKALYNQTRVSDVFNLMEFDPFVRDILLS